MNKVRKEVQKLVEEAMLAKLEYYQREPDLDPSPHHDTILGFLNTTLQDLRLQKKIDPFKNLQPGLRKTFCYKDRFQDTIVYYGYCFQVHDELYHSALMIHNDFYKENGSQLLAHRIIDGRLLTCDRVTDETTG